MQITDYVTGSQRAGWNRVNRLAFPIDVGRVSLLLFFVAVKKQPRTARLQVPQATSRPGIIRLELTEWIQAIVLQRLDHLLRLGFPVNSHENQGDQTEENRFLYHFGDTLDKDAYVKFHRPRTVDLSQVSITSVKLFPS
jgi:hypothetical protein